MAAPGSFVTLENSSLSLFCNLKSSSAMVSVNVPSCSKLDAFCGARSAQDPRNPLTPYSPVARVFLDLNSQTEASAIIASGDALGDPLCADSAPYALFSRIEV